MKTPAKTTGLTPLAPLRWKIKQPKPEKLCSDMELAGDHLWLFNRQNVVYRLSLDGQVEQTWQLPNPIERFLVDGDTLRVFDNTGTLFDLSRKEPRPVSQLSQISPLPTVLLHRGSQVVLGNKGVITVHDARGRERWNITIKGANPRAFCVDNDGIYVSAGPDIHALDWSGSLRWKATTGKWAVWRLWQSQSHLYVTTTREGLRVFDKTGEQLAMSRFKAGFTSACACDDKPLFITTGSGRLKAWSDAAEIVWELKLDSGLVCTTRVRGDTAYVMSYEFGLMCVDLSEKARAASARQKLPATTILQMPAPQEAPAKTVAKTTTKTAAKTATKTAAKAPAKSAVKTAKAAAKAPAKGAAKAPAKGAAKAAKATKTTSKAPAKAAKGAAKGAAKAPAKAAKAAPRGARVGAAPSASSVTVECFQDGNEIRVRVVSKGYNRDWSCQFPRHLRVAGARYKVDGVAASAKGGFYRVVGNIHRL